MKTTINLEEMNRDAVAHITEDLADSARCLGIPVRDSEVFDMYRDAQNFNTEDALSELAHQHKIETLDWLFFKDLQSLISEVLERYLDWVFLCDSKNFFEIKKSQEQARGFISEYICNEILYVDFSKETVETFLATIKVHVVIAKIHEFMIKVVAS